jgi:hypothetical protein
MEKGRGEERQGSTEEGEKEEARKSSRKKEEDAKRKKRRTTLNDGSLDITQAPHKNPKPKPPPSKKKKNRIPKRYQDFRHDHDFDNGIDVGKGVGANLKKKKRSRGQNAKTASKNAEPANQERREMARWTDGRGLTRAHKKVRTVSVFVCRVFESSSFTLQRKEKKTAKETVSKRRVGSRSTEREGKGKVRAGGTVVEASQKKRRTNRTNRKQATQKTETKPIQKQQKAETAAAESNDSTNGGDRVRILLFCMCCCV